MSESHGVALSEMNPVTLMHLVENLSSQHWDEVPFGDFDIGLDLVHDSYEEMYKSGHCRAVIAHNEDGHIVGYVIVLASEMLHHKGTYQMTTDSFYVAPSYRRLGVFGMMMDKVEALCSDNGIRFMSYVVNPQYSDCFELESWLVDKGFQCTEKSYTKEVK